MSTPEPTPTLDFREWTFRHRRFDRSSGKMMSEWTDHNGEERLYGDVPTGARPGTIWNVRCTEDGTRADPKHAVYTGRKVVAEPAWDLDDAAAQTQKRLQADLRRSSTKDEIDNLTIREVRAALASRKTWDARAAYLAVIMERIGASA